MSELDYGPTKAHLRLSMGELTKFLSACGLVHLGVRGSPQSDLSSHDGQPRRYLDFFSAAATLVFFLSIAAAFVGILALLTRAT
jgi:hypothetical protein